MWFVVFPFKLSICRQEREKGVRGKKPLAHAATFWSVACHILLARLLLIHLSNSVVYEDQSISSCSLRTAVGLYCGMSGAFPAALPMVVPSPA